MRRTYMMPKDIVILLAACLRAFSIVLLAEDPACMTHPRTVLRLVGTNFSTQGFWNVSNCRCDCELA